MTEIARYLPLWGELDELSPISHNPSNILFSAVNKTTSENVIICFTSYSSSITEKEIQDAIYNYHTLTSKAYLMPIKKYVLFERKNGCFDSFMCMPYYESINKNRNLLNADNFLDFTLQICEALDVLHKSEIIHGNINPDNIFYAGSGKWLLGGQIHTKGKRITSTRTEYVHTVYTAPELASGNSPNKFSDIYAFGILLYELVYPYINRKSNELKVTSNALQGIVDIILKASATLPQNRWQSISEMYGALQASQNNSSEQMAKRYPELAHYFTVFDPDNSVVYKPPAAVDSFKPLDVYIVRKNNLQLISLIAVAIAAIIVVAFIIYGIRMIPKLEL